jgi:hypothetical protein
LKKRNIGGASYVVRPVTKHLENYVGRPENFSSIVCDFRALGGVIGVGVTGSISSAGFNDYLESRLGEIGDYRWD